MNRGGVEPGGWLLLLTGLVMPAGLPLFGLLVADWLTRLQVVD